MIDIEIGKLFHTQTEGTGLISASGFSALYRSLESKGYDRLASVINDLFSWDDKGNEWRIWNNEDKEKGKTGKWTKRFAAYLKQNYDMPITAETMGYMGEVLEKFVDKDKTDYWFEFTKFSDWKHGAFEGRITADGNPPGACWWNDYSEVRLGLTRHKQGYSVLFYESPEQHYKYSKEKGVGRCWLFNTDDGPVIFNAYGVPLSTIAGQLAEIWKKTFKKITVSSDKGYINAGNHDNMGRRGGENGLGYIIGPKKKLETISKVHLPDFSLIPDGNCSKCGKEIMKKRCVHIGDDYLCTGCRDSLATQCEYCRDWEYREFLQKAYRPGHNVLVCRQCAKIHCHNCHKHGLTLLRTYRVWHASREYCDECIRIGEALHCPSCGRYVDKYISIKFSPRYSTRVCVPCHKKAKEIPHA